MRNLALLVLFAAPPNLFAASPVVVDPDLALELVADAPDIVTPTGIAVDAKGRVWCLENHTHQRTPNYNGPATDRVRIFEEFDAAGRAKKVTTFAEGFRDSMGITFGSDGPIYVATRAAIYILREQNGKEVERKVLVKLETKGNYPHNGLCGFAWDANGDLIFGLGENLGEPYKIVGTDNSTMTGGGEGGSMYRCRPDGSKISRIATGFWNPFAHCFDAHGRLFMVDNDPDARGPCRLCHIIQGGDYGYRFRYGRKGLHPFTSWNGELPGTLPMAGGTSEAPSGVIACDFAAMPKDYAGKLLVTSWGDHTIEAFTLTPRGASVSATPKVIVRGDENFRPVGFAIAPDGSILVSDWVDKSYPVHGKGRIWRLRSKTFSGKPKVPVSPIPARSEAQWHALAKSSKSPAERMEALLHLQSLEFTREFLPLLGDEDPFLVSAALTALGRVGNVASLRDAASAKPQARVRLGILLALRKSGEVAARLEIPRFLSDDDPEVRRAAIQWVAEEKIKEHAGLLRAAAIKSPSSAGLLASLGMANTMLSDRKMGSPAEEADHAIAFNFLVPDDVPPEIRAIALRMLPPDHKMIHPGMLERYVRGDNEFGLECVRTARLRRDPRALSALIDTIAFNSNPEHRLAAVAGISGFTDTDRAQQELLRLLDDPMLRKEALRSLRGVTKQADAIVKWWDGHRAATEDPLKIDRELLQEYQTTLRSLKLLPDEKPPTKEEWRAYLKDAPGDAKAGERLFYHARGPLCYNCHRIDARGGNVGPDMTMIGKSMSREKLIESILEPSKEIAPMYTTWRVTMRDGKEFTGAFAGETHDSLVTLVDAAGKLERLRRADIEERAALKTSIMPDELPHKMSRREFADLIAFLLERK